MSEEHRFPAWTAFRFMAGALLVLLATGAVSEVAAPVYPLLRAQTGLLRERREQVRAVAVGNSHGRALDFGAAGMAGVHLSRSGQDPFESVYLARFAIDEGGSIRYVFMTASYAMQRMDHAVVAGRDQTELRREIYARTPLRRPIPGDARHWIGGKLAPVARPDHWKEVLDRMRGRRHSVEMDADGRPWRPSAPPITQDSLARHGVFRAAAHRSEGAAVVELAPDTPDRVLAALDGLATTLHRRGARLVLYTPPYHESYRGGQDPAVVAEGARILGEVVARHPNAVWLDFSRHAEFNGRADLFENSDHLNTAGARRFSALLRRCLDEVERGTTGDASGCPPPGAPLPSARLD